jgi:hypothetical protein
VDYAFAPGTTDQDARLRLLLKARSNTTLRSAGTSIEDFLNDLNSSSLTADDLVVGSHASDEGFLFLALDGSHNTLPVSYDDLQAVDTSGSIHIPAAVRGPGTKFHFKGCTIGSDDSLPFLTLLKSALDNPTQVTAPKFFHGLRELTSVGVFEFMGYNFKLLSKDGFTKTADLVKAYQNATPPLTRLDGTQVPDADIKKWVRPQLVLKPALHDKKPIPFPVKIVPAAGGQNAIPDPPAECRSKHETYTYDLNAGAPPPKDKAAQLAAMRASLSAEPDQQSTHAYPIYKRLHYDTFDDFFDGQNWTVTVNGNDQHWAGTHFVYTLVIPVGKPGTPDELIFNFYPSAGAPTMNFLEDNATYSLFGVV